MTKNTANKRFLTRIALPLTTMIVMLVGCKNNNSSNSYYDEDDCTASVVEYLLQENHRLTDSLAVVNERLDDCESARSKRCPCVKTPTPRKKITAPKITKPVITKPVVTTPVATKPTATKPASTTNQVIIKENNGGNNTVIIGNNNTVNTVVINSNSTPIQDTVAQVKTTTRVLSGYARSTYTYTK